MYQNDAMKVLTGEVRLSYANLTTPRAAQQGGEPKYSVTLLIPKSDAATKADIDAAIQAAANEALAKVWNGARPPMLKVPIYDGDGVRPSGVPFGDECKGHWVMTASTKNKPQVVGIDNINCELSPADIYSGMYGRVTVRFFGYSNSGNKGIGCGLGNVLKTRDGELLRPLPPTVRRCPQPPVPTVSSLRLPLPLPLRCLGPPPAASIPSPASPCDKEERLMNTRFDGQLWIGAFGVTLEVKEMETGHLLNTVKMLLQKPARVQAMLVADIENATFAEPQAWTANRKEDIRKVSVHNITSLSAEELVEYVKGTTLFNTMLAELEARGVNTENIMQLYTTDEAFRN